MGPGFHSSSHGIRSKPYALYQMFHRSFPMSCMKRLLLALLLVCFSPQSGAATPNIILFVTDDQSPIAGCYGHTDIKTPHLDSLAAEGTRFTHAFATTASCSASRSVILSGLHNHRNGQYGHTHDFHKFASFPAVAAVSLPLQMKPVSYTHLTLPTKA